MRHDHATEPNRLARNGPPALDSSQSITPAPGNAPAQGPNSASLPGVPPEIPDHELLGRIGKGSYGEVWLARNIVGTYRAVKIVYRNSFANDRPFEREFKGIQKFEPISRSHESQFDILHIGRNGDCFYYVMELADDASSRSNCHKDLAAAGKTTGAE